MKLRENIDSTAFLEAVQKCEGDIYFEMPEGSRMNLKSVLSQYVFVVLTGQKDVINSGRVVCSKEDESMLMSYLEC